jgi:hypothetical protein
MIRKEWDLDFNQFRGKTNHVDTVNSSRKVVISKTENICPRASIGEVVSRKFILRIY